MRNIGYKFRRILISIIPHKLTYLFFIYLFRNLDGNDYSRGMYYRYYQLIVYNKRNSFPWT